MSSNYEESKNAYPFSYVVQVVCAGGSVGAGTLLFMADSYFEVQYFLATSSADLPGEVAPNNFSCTITDQGTGVTLSSGRVPQRLGFASMFNSSPEIVPVRFYPQSSLLFDVLNFTPGPGTLTVTFVLKGMKIRIH